MTNLPTNLPNIEIIQDGKQVVRPDVMALVTQLAQLSQLNRLRKLEESKVPTGTKSFKWVITDTVHEITLGTPWISFSLINDGTGDVYVRVNNQDGPLTEEAEVNSGETKTVDLGYPVITKLFLVAASGTSATVRVFAEEGKWL